LLGRPEPRQGPRLLVEAVQNVRAEAAREYWAKASAEAAREAVVTARAEVAMLWRPESRCRLRLS
jgi:hypothetical protein